ncbi:hypothetical protein [Streptomyces sp. NBRC 110028]|uniref:hypothetical protein n=1 Tax=Streptomyces sp. NBRC 110028 TaxID=1621260 RepID=UPI0006E2E142|nr:hypothetical protein [Streptomyces sp. NBRC 110028]
MTHLAGGIRAGAIGAVGLLACGVLTACGSDGDSGGKDRKTSSAAASGGGSGNGGTTAVRTAYRKTAEEETARMTLRTETSAAGKSAVARGEGAIDLEDGDSTMTISAGGQKVEQRVVDKVVYQKLPPKQRAQVPGDKPWIKIDLKKAAAEQNSGSSNQINDPAQSASYAKGITDRNTEKVGTGTVDGVKTTRYRVTVDIDKLSGAAALKRQVGPTVPMDVWLDDQGRIRRQQITMNIKPTDQPKGTAAPKKLTVRTLIEFSDFGTEVDPKAPPAGRTTDMTGKR